jgi:hypothetical protein
MEKGHPHEEVALTVQILDALMTSVTRSAVPQL